MNTGKLNRRITYTTGATYTDTALGGKTLSVAGTQVQTWCSARQLSMREQISYGLPTDYSSFEFEFIYERGANIVRGMDLTYES
jgi:head-tail adaptor